MIKVRNLTKGIFYADSYPVCIGSEEVDFLKSEVGSTETRRTRICAHEDIEDKLHEMFIALSSETYIRPHKHLRKSESLHVVEGLADAVFFDENQNITQIIQLSPYGARKNFYYRIKDPVYHTLVLHTEMFIFHETSCGPFVREDTEFAPWAPGEDDTEAVKKYMKELKETVRQCGQSR